MTTTTYSIHRAYDHSIAATFGIDDDMAKAAISIAEADYAAHGDKTIRYYLHNGRGVVAAFMTRQGAAHQVLRDDYLQFSDKAKAKRTEAVLFND